MQEITRYTENGVAVHAFKNPALHGFYLSLFFKAGALYERDGEAGITHFLEHVAIRNVEKISDGALYRDLDRNGLDMNATTYSEMIQFYIAGSTAKFPIGARYLAMLLSPLCLDRQEIDAERKRIKAEIRESDDKGSLATFSNSLVYRATPLASSILGSIGSVNAIGLSKLEAYRRSVSTKENLFFYLTGGFSDGDLDLLCREIERYEIGSAPVRDNTAPLPKGFFARGPEIAVKPADYTAVRFCFDLDMKKLTVPETDLLYDILLSGNSSRFYLEMSERRGLFYDVSGTIERYRNIGSFCFFFEVKERDLLLAVDLAVRLLAECKEELLRPEDLMKAGYVDNAYTLYDDAREFNFSYAYDNHICGADYRTVEDRVKAYDAVTPERVREVARIVFRPENLVMTIKGNPRKINLKALKEIVNQLNETE